MLLPVGEMSPKSNKTSLSCGIRNTPSLMLRYLVLLYEGLHQKGLVLVQQREVGVCKQVKVNGILI